MTALSNDMIKQLLAGQRSRGDYDKVFADFLASGEPAIEVPTDSGVLAGKSADNVKTGLENAKKRTDQNGKLVHEGAPAVKVIKQEDTVYLINTSLVEGETSDENDEEFAGAQ